MGEENKEFTIIEKPDLMPILLREFPGFQGRWEGHVKWWNSRPAGALNGLMEFVHFVVEDLYEKQESEALERVFDLMESFLATGNEYTRGLIGYGFFETLQCVASHKPYGNQVFVPLLRPMSVRVWNDLNVMWAGKSSLADVIRAENSQDAAHSTPEDRGSDTQD